MRIIAGMANKNHKVYVRTNRAIRGALKKVHNDVGVSPAFIDRKGVLSQEVFIAASWLWMTKLDPEELARNIAPFVAEAEAAIPKPGAMKRAEANAKLDTPEVPIAGGTPIEDGPESSGPKKGRKTSPSVIETEILFPETEKPPSKRAKK